MRYCTWEPNKVLQYDGEDDVGPADWSRVSPGKQAKGGVAKKARLFSPTKDVSHQQVEPVIPTFRVCYTFFLTADNVTCHSYGKPNQRPFTVRIQIRYSSYGSFAVAFICTYYIIHWVT